MEHYQATVQLDGVNGAEIVLTFPLPTFDLATLKSELPPVLEAIYNATDDLLNEAFESKTTKSRVAINFGLRCLGGMTLGLHINSTYYRYREIQRSAIHIAGRAATALGDVRRFMRKR